MLGAMQDQIQPGSPIQAPPAGPQQPHRAGIILALGIVGLVFGCGGWILGIIAWVMANADLAKMDRGVMDASGRSTTQAGKICAIVAVVLHLITLLIGIVWMVFVLGVMGMAAAAGAKGSP
ncbi:MAG: hypothetical protein U0573_09770 [Phycisphaerales bacterium]